MQNVCLKPGHALSEDWGSFEVRLPRTTWKSLLDEFYLPKPSTVTSSMRSYQLQDGLKILVVDAESKDSLKEALAELRKSQQDPVIGIDLEWRPDFVRGACSPVSLIQLASSSVAVLIQTTQMANKGLPLPIDLRAFFQDPSVVYVASGWDTSDQKKLLHSFRVGKEVMRRFYDVYRIGFACGFPKPGLASLAQTLLHVTLPKSKKITMSNWAAKELEANQIQYAAIDAFMAGEVFRALKASHFHVHQG